MSYSFFSHLPPFISQLIIFYQIIFSFYSSSSSSSFTSSSCSTSFRVISGSMGWQKVILKFVSSRARHISFHHYTTPFLNKSRVQRSINKSLNEMFLTRFSFQNNAMCREYNHRASYHQFFSKNPRYRGSAKFSQRSRRQNPTFIWV